MSQAIQDAKVVKPDSRIWPMATDLASCLCQQIAAANLPEPCFCGVLPGLDVALDYCAPCSGGKCGMAWVRLATAGRMSDLIGSPGAGGVGSVFALPSKCDVALAATFEVGIVRCAPTLGEDGDLPTMADQLAAAELQYADMAASRLAALCCFSDGRAVTLGVYSPIGPEGGCLGGVWSVTVGEF